MIHHVGYPVSDLDKSVEFFLAALKPLGYEKVLSFPGVHGLGANKMPDFWLSQYDGSKDPPREVVKSLHIAFAAKDRAEVDAFYAAAIEAGGKCNGKPGPRPQYTPTYYGAFVFDLDGNNVEVMLMPEDGYSSGCASGEKQS